MQSGAELARKWATDLPLHFARKLAEALAQGEYAVQRLRQQAVGPGSKAAITAALQLVARGEGAYVAGLLDGRLDTAAEHPQITAVWTGPGPAPAGHRLTVAVVADLISEAVDSLLLVSFATFPGRAVSTALHRAAARGVDVTLLLERTIDNPGFHGCSDPLAGLSAHRLHWPADRRRPGASMHAKVLVVDDRIALVGSANLTGMALESNIECGILIRGGELPARISAHVLKTPDLELV